MELKPCPFCGGGAEIYKFWITDTYTARCGVCECALEECGKSQEEAMAAWNRRDK